MENNIGDKRLKLPIPYSILEIIDRIVDMRVGDGEHNVSRTMVALELLKIGARFEKKRLDNIETGANPFDNRHEEQLAYIARKVVAIETKIRRLITIQVHGAGIDKELVDRVVSSIDLTPQDKTVLTRLFVEIEELKKEINE